MLSNDNILCNGDILKSVISLAQILLNNYNRKILVKTVNTSYSSIL